MKTEKGHKKKKCNRRIYECRIHECMLNVRETKLSHKFEVANENDGAKIWLVAVKYPYSTTLFAKNLLYFTFCASQYSMALNLAKKPDVWIRSLILKGRIFAISRL